MADRSFGQIMALMAEHDQLKDPHATVIDDGFIRVVCQRLDSLQIPPVSSDEVRRAWLRQREAVPGPAPRDPGQEGA